MAYIKPFHEVIILFLPGSILIISCDKTQNPNDTVESTKPETFDLTKLPLGGIDPAKMLIQNQGNPQPDFLSLWLCGLPANGAGDSDASDWTNAHGAWDYTRKPQVEGGVAWNHIFDITLDGNGNRIITGNNLSNHTTCIFSIQKGTETWNYDINSNIISV